MLLLLLLLFFPAIRYQGYQGYEDDSSLFLFFFLLPAVAPFAIFSRKKRPRVRAECFTEFFFPKKIFFFTEFPSRVVPGGPGIRRRSPTVCSRCSGGPRCSSGAVQAKRTSSSTRLCYQLLVEIFGNQNEQDSISNSVPLDDERREPSKEGGRKKETNSVKKNSVKRDRLSTGHTKPACD